MKDWPGRDAEYVCPLPGCICNLIGFDDDETPEEDE